MMIKRSGRIAIWCCILALGIALACSSERGTGPVGLKYRLYVGMAGQNNRIYSIDVENDSILDSSGTALFLTSVPTATPDGKYVLAARGSAATDVLDAVSLSKIAELPGCGTRITFADEDGLILGIRQRCISLVSYPSFTLAFEDSLALDEFPRFADPLIVDASRGLLYTRLFYGDTRIERTELLAWDYRSKQVYDQWALRIDESSGIIDLKRFTLSPDGSFLYALGASPQGPIVFCYDLAGRQIVWHHPIPTSIGVLAMTPDGEELWRTDRGSITHPILTGYVFVHDPATGQVTDSISLFGYASDPVLPLLTMEMAFTPDGRKAFLATVDVARFMGPVLVVDAVKKQVSKLLFPDAKHAPFYLDIAPSP